MTFIRHFRSVLRSISGVVYKWIFRRTVNPDQFRAGAKARRPDEYSTGSFVTAMSTTVHENPDTSGDDPREFKGFQWAESNKEAVMTGPGHIPFGLGRFACPGRVLAVNGELPSVERVLPDP